MSGKIKYFSIDEARDYLSQRIPTSTMVGSITGASIGYYTGQPAALHSVTYGLGMGLGSTAFYSGVYLLRCARESDDVYN